VGDKEKLRSKNNDFRIMALFWTILDNPTPHTRQSIRFKRQRSSSINDHNKKSAIKKGDHEDNLASIVFPTELINILLEAIFTPKMGDISMQQTKRTTATAQREKRDKIITFFQKFPPEVATNTKINSVKTRYGPQARDSLSSSGGLWERQERDMTTTMHFSRM
jgi:hypothetical protein